MRGFIWLVVVVLAAIGVGVGAEAAVGHATYGPPGYGFAAAFSVPLVQREATIDGRTASVTFGSRPGLYETVYVVVHPNAPLWLQQRLGGKLLAGLHFLPGGIPSGWVGVAPVQAPGCGSSHSSWEPASSTNAVTSFFLLPATHRRPLCVGEVHIEAPGVQWSATALGISKHNVHSFIDSVSPVTR